MQNVNLSDAPQCWGAKAVPFADQITAPPFITPTVTEALELLNETAALRSAMVLRGDNGVGKSHLLRHWVAGLDNKRYRPVVITHASLTGSGVMANLLLKLGCHVSHLRSNNLATLEDAVTALGRTILLLALDEAQLYVADALEEIRLLLGLSLPAQPLFSLVLAGDNYLVDTLRLHHSRALYSRIAASVQILPLEPQQVPDYLAHHLAIVGIVRPCFDQAALQMLTAAANGIPRTINLIARAAWLDATRNNLQTIGPDNIRAALRRVPMAADNTHPSS